MPCFGKTYCYFSKTIHSVGVFKRFLLWSRDIPNMGVVRNIWRKRESNKHGKLWYSLDFRSQKNPRGFEISLATDSNRLVVKFLPLKIWKETQPCFLMQMCQSDSGHSSEQSTAHFSSRSTVSQLKGVSGTISDCIIWESPTSEDTKFHRH